MSMLNEVRPADAVPRDRSFKGRIKELLPWKGDDKREIIRKIVYLVAVCALIWSFVDAIQYKFGTSDLHESHDYLSDLYHKDEDSSPSNIDADQSPDIGAVTDSPTVPNGSSDSDNTDQSGDVTDPVDPEISKYPAGMMPRFKALYDINPDIIGWITIDGITDSRGNNIIDYPVMQCDDNDYYLDHDFMRTEKNYGALFADYNVKITKDSGPANTIIYGHNMGAGTYFSRLHDYKKRVSFVSEHRVIKYDTLWEENEYIVIGCFLAGIREDQDNIPIFRYHLIYNFNDLSDFDYWYKNVMYRSYYTSDIECTKDDEYITLSTCSTEIYDSRFVVVARKLREGEDPSVYTYKSNANARKPAAFYEAYGLSVPKDSGPDYEYYVPGN